MKGGGRKEKRDDGWCVYLTADTRMLTLKRTLNMKSFLWVFASSLAG
jgi:hypothetical protein